MKLATCNSCKSEYNLDFNNISGHGKGSKLQLDRKSLHLCTQQQQNEVVQTTQETREAKIEKLAVDRTESLNRIAEAISKNNGQNIADAIYMLSQSLSEIAQAIKTLAPIKQQIGVVT